MAVEKEFKDFIKRFGIGVAFGLTIAWVFKDFVDSVINGLIKPLVNLAIATDEWTAWTVKIGTAEIKTGEITSAAVDVFVVVLILFLIIKVFFGTKKIPK